MKKIELIVAASVLLLFGCGEATNEYKPSDDSIDSYIELYDWQSSEVEEDNCLAFTYLDREYLFYNNYNGTINTDQVKECVGFTVQDGEIKNDEIILTLASDESNNYLLIYNIGPDLMKAPHAVYRAADTRGKNIYLPDFVEETTEGNPMYTYWHK